MGEEDTEGVMEEEKEEGRKEGFVSKGAVTQEKFIGRGGQKSRCPGAKANKERSCLLLHCTDEMEEKQKNYTKSDEKKTTTTTIKKEARKRGKCRAETGGGSGLVS